MHQRLAAGDRHHRRAAFLNRAEALFGRQILFQNVGRVLDLAASGAGQVAAEERLQHQDQRVALASGKLLAQDVAGHRPHLRYRYWHEDEPLYSIF